MLWSTHGKGKRIGGIILDLGGTLNFTLQKLGLPKKSPEFIASYIGLGRDFLIL